MLERLKIDRELDGAMWHYRERNTTLPMHRHNELEANLVTRGVGSYMLSDRRYELGPGSLVWLFPGQLHELTSRSSDMEMWVVVFRPRLLARLCTSASLRPLRRRDPSEAFCRCLSPSDAAWLNGLAGEVKQSCADAPVFNAGLSYWLLRGWQAYGRAPDRPGGQPLHPAVRAASRLLTKDQHDLSLRSLSEQVALSPARLSHLFHQQLGVRLTDYRNRVRLRRFFQHYLQQPQMKMLHLALRAGFGSYPQFHRIFSQHMRCSPRTYFSSAQPRNVLKLPARLD